MPWIACIFPKDCPIAYVDGGMNIVWTKKNAKRFSTKPAAMEAATKTAFVDECIDAEEVDDDKSS